MMRSRMNRRFALIFFTVLGVLSALVHEAAGSGAPSSQANGMRDTLRQGVDRAFNMDYPGADALFQKAVALDPEDPTGYAFQALNHLFGSEVSFDPKQREASQDAMLRCVGEALARGEQRVEKNPRDGQAWFAMAMARMAKFRWALRKKQTLTAAQEAYGLWSCLERAQQEDPENHDSYLLTGLIRYHIDRLPDLSRFLSSLLVTQGDRLRGLQDLERAAARGDLLRELARSELISVYLNFEKQPARALPLARELQRRYPRNYNFSFALAGIQSEMEHFREALAIARDLERGIAAGKQPFAPQLRPRHDQLLGRIYFNQGDYARAEDCFRRSLMDTSEYNSRVRVWSYVRLGMIHDVRDEREQAMELYSMALAVDSGASIAKVEARQYLKTPYRPAPRS
jgi:tetratricopeptide (TPR) repeat protein